MNNFEIAAGSVVGRDHRRVGKNNQDAYLFKNFGDSIVGLVSDGCGSVKRSEFGSQALVRITLNVIGAYLPLLEGYNNTDDTRFIFWTLVRERILEDLSKVACSMSRDEVFALNEYMLATLLGFIIGPKKTYLFSIGDGEIYLNGKLIKTGSFPDNAPPYIAYGLLGEKQKFFSEDMLNFSIDAELETSELESLLIGTDGLADLRKKSDELIPGKNEKIGPINIWWERDIFFKNIDAVRRRLFLINSDIIKVRYDKGGKFLRLDRFSGALRDDTSFVVLRRKKGGEDDEGACQQEGS